VQELRLGEPAVQRDRALLIVGIVLMVAGVVVAIYGYALSHAATNDQRQQLDGITVGLIGVAVSVVGAALFLRYSIGHFLRFWLARFVYEQRASTDRVVDAISGESTD
jgi:uncharacterized membrane protein HdeD (DUF308 family)